MPDFLNGHSLRTKPFLFARPGATGATGATARSLALALEFTFTFALAVALALAFAVTPVHASVSIGSGFSSVTSGRTAPSLSVGWFGSSWALTGMTSGVNTPLYYHSAWMISGLRTWSNGDLGWGPLSSGFGLSLFYARRGYRETTTSAIDEADDYNVGPCFRVGWNFLGPAYLAVEGMFGLRRPMNLIVLSAQDVAHVTVGVEF
jgi:hypothetical protein